MMRRACAMAMTLDLRLRAAACGDEIRDRRQERLHTAEHGENDQQDGDGPPHQRSNLIRPTGTRNQPTYRGAGPLTPPAHAARPMERGRMRK